MPGEYRIGAPLDAGVLEKLKAGDMVYLNGEVYAARDAAHKKIIGLLDSGEKLPLEINGQIIYYTGPCPPKPGCVIGSAGPTTSGRMDAYAPRLLSLGLKGMIGKGSRSAEVIEAMVRCGAVYFAAAGGAGALLARCIIRQEVIAFPELGPEALRKLVLKDFPAIVAIDIYGNDLYKTGKEVFRNGGGY